MDQLITVIVSALIGAIVANLSNLWQARGFIHEKIHENRARLYPAAWQLTGLLPLWPQTKTLTYESLSKLAIEVQTGYYHEDGMYLSGAAHRAWTKYIE